MGNDLVVCERDNDLEIVIDGQTETFQSQANNLKSIIVQAYRGYVTMSAINWLTAHSISMSMLDVRGQIKSSINPRSTPAGLLNVQQLRIHEDRKERLKLAIQLIEDKVRSQLEFLNDLSKYYPVDAHSIDDIQVSRSNRLKTLQDVMLYEAQIAKAYWCEMAKVINLIAPELKFNGRDTRDSNGRNAGNVVNASLNYLYAVLEHQVRASLFAHGFDVTIGIVHESMPGKQPLVYDVIEQFRYIADMTVIDMLSAHQLRKNDFKLQPNYVMTSKPETAKKLIDKMQYNLSRKVKINGLNNSMWTVIDRQCVALKDYYLSGKKIPSISTLPLEKNMTMKIKEWISSVSVSEARELGIGKSTLWYLKHRDQNKVYGKVYEKIRESID